MDYDLASMLAALGMLARGNAFVDRLSIGLPSSPVPPLPDKIDGPVARGLAGHGCFEGTLKLIYKTSSWVLAQFGNNSTVTGPRNIINTRVMQEFKLKRFEDSQAADKKVRVYRELISSSLVPRRHPSRFEPPRKRNRPTNRHTVLLAHPLSPGANDANGVYVPDSADITDPSSKHTSLESDAALANIETDGAFPSLLNAIRAVFPQCPAVLPRGAADV
ncbi:hypothetical protein FPV67DRAFT_1452159 [Lyophyllum atratum]|nr:hypothetical protein FPV67DRAFT_1452159 [Lyophyllum atratum]